MGILIILLPLAVYIITAFSVPKRLLQKPDDFYTAYKKVGNTAFSSSSVAYAFQVGTIYPFLLWSISKMYFVPFVNTICWGIGILLFLLSFNKWKKFINKDITLHGFLGETYGSRVRLVASYITIIGLTGFLISEVYFGSKVLLSIIDNRNVFYILIFAAILLVFVYVTYGGQQSSVRTDQLQLMVSYTGIFGTMLYLSYLIITNDTAIPFELKLGLLFLVIYIPIVLFIRKGRFIRLSESKSKLVKSVNTFFNILIVVLLVSLVGTSLYKLFYGTVIPSQQNILNLDGFGIPGLISLAILPLMFQFVDLTNWQRILAVNEDDDKAGLHKRIKTGLLTYAIESPFTWVIFIFFGLLVIAAFPHFSFQDLLIDLPKQLIHAPSLVENFFGYVFILSIVSIMLSTVDSFIVGIIYAYAYDINKKTREIIESRDENKLKENYRLVTRAGKYFGLIIATASVILFIIFDNVVVNGGELFINLLLAFYSAQLSFFPLIFGKLFLKKQPSGKWASASMIVGATAGIGLGIYSVIWNPDYGWYPIIVCVVLSTTLYSIGYFFSSKTVIATSI